MGSAINSDVVDDNPTYGAPYVGSKVRNGCLHAGTGLWVVSEVCLLRAFISECIDVSHEGHVLSEKVNTASLSFFLIGGALDIIGRLCRKAAYKDDFLPPPRKWEHKLDYATYGCLVVALGGCVVDAASKNDDVSKGASWFSLMAGGGEILSSMFVKSLWAYDDYR